MKSRSASEYDDIQMSYSVNGHLYDFKIRRCTDITYRQGFLESFILSKNTEIGGYVWAGYDENNGNNQPRTYVHPNGQLWKGKLVHRANIEGQWFEPGEIPEFDRNGKLGKAATSFVPNF